MKNLEDLKWLIQCLRMEGLEEHAKALEGAFYSNTGGEFRCYVGLYLSQIPQDQVSEETRKQVIDLMERIKS